MFFFFNLSNKNRSNQVITLFIFLQFSLLSIRGNAQNSIIHDLEYGFVLGIRTLKEPVTKPRESLFTLGFLGAGTAFLITQDAHLRQAVFDSRNGTKDALAQYVGEPFGNPYFHLIFLGGSYLGAKLLHSATLTEKSTKMLTAAAVSGVSVLALKSLFARQRPYTGEDARAFFTRYFAGEEYLSFPSGHSILAFTFASSATYLFPQQLWVPFVFYPLAGLTAWSRMYDDKHWASDVLVGAVLGHLIGKAVAQQERVRLGVVSNSWGGMNLSAGFNF